MVMKESTRNLSIPFSVIRYVIRNGDEGIDTQFIDKNCEKIFEGDLVRTNANVPNGHITKSAYGDWVIRENSMITRVSEILENKWNIEIVGNIFGISKP
jgi:hypothetical protein